MNGQACAHTLDKLTGSVRLAKRFRAILHRSPSVRAASTTLRRARRQLWSVARTDSAGSAVAAQLPSKLRASSEREPGSAV
jgi:hypothetical protein